MARRRRSSPSGPSRRGASVTASVPSRPLPGRSFLPSGGPSPGRKGPRPSNPVGDRRFYNPVAASIRPATLFSGSPARVVVASPPQKPRLARSGPTWRGFLSQLSFRTPAKVAVCVRRGVRREVLAARGALGANRPGRRGPFSSVRC